MRALANTAAESAIQAYARQSQKREIKWKSLVALLSLLGPASLFVAGYNTGSTTALVGSLAFVAVCCVLAVRAISSSYRWKALTIPTENGGAACSGNRPPAERAEISPVYTPARPQKGHWAASTLADGTGSSERKALVSRQPQSWHLCSQA